MSLIDGKPERVPAAFFLHFDPSFHKGKAAIDKHAEYFRYTDMDIVKIQYEHKFPEIPEIKNPGDWKKAPLYSKDFFADQIDVVAGLVKELSKEALVVITLYSPFMCAGHSVSGDTLARHLADDPAAVAPGMQNVTNSLMAFVNACIDVGVDGFYASTQGGESHRPYNASVFEQFIKPYDLQIWQRIDAACRFNILHVCDYQDTYDKLDPYRDYPGQIVNCGLKLTEGSITGKRISELFGRPFMGGLDRHGIIVDGSKEEIHNAAREAVEQGPKPMMLAADCTLPSDISWDNIKTAIDTAHQM